ncbi:hypothetical protein G9A89_021258 [Geosiphon pyriformis]|nr:hypothetical protein G9A89_021258 [Geosiphon pyriformis]
MTSFFAAGAFVNNTIWVESSQAATQFILDIASNFFAINNISINNDKTVVIPINQRVQNTVLRISELLILIVRCGVSHRYLGIFLSTDDLSKPSLAKTQSDINEVLYHLLLYGLKTFKQVQAEEKSASVISFSNSFGIVGQLFEHYFLDLQVLDWVLLNPLHFLKRFGSVDVAGGAMAFFPKIGLGIGIRVVSFLSSIMAKLQAVALTLKCVLFSCLVEGFVSVEWFKEAMWIFENCKETVWILVDFV